MNMLPSGYGLNMAVGIILLSLGTPSKNKNVIFSDIVQKGRRGSGSNHYFRTFGNNDILGRWDGDEESVSLFK